QIRVDILTEAIDAVRRNGEPGEVSKQLVPVAPACREAIWQVTDIGFDPHVDKTIEDKCVARHRRTITAATWRLRLDTGNQRIMKALETRPAERHHEHIFPGERVELPQVAH